MTQTNPSSAVKHLLLTGLTGEGKSATGKGIGARTVPGDGPDSVTSHVDSYGAGSNLIVIDTPGPGDTRGDGNPDNRHSNESIIEELIDFLNYRRIDNLNYVVWTTAGGVRFNANDPRQPLHVIGQLIHGLLGGRWENVIILVRGLADDDMMVGPTQGASYFSSQGPTGIMPTIVRSFIEKENTLPQELDLAQRRGCFILYKGEHAQEENRRRLLDLFKSDKDIKLVDSNKMCRLCRQRGNPLKYNVMCHTGLRKVHLGTAESLEHHGEASTEKVHGPMVHPHIYEAQYRHLQERPEEDHGVPLFQVLATVAAAFPDPRISGGVLVVAWVLDRLFNNSPPPPSVCLNCGGQADTKGCAFVWTCCANPSRTTNKVDNGCTAITRCNGCTNDVASAEPCETQCTGCGNEVSNPGCRSVKEHQLVDRDD